MNSKSVFNICLKVLGVYYALSALNMLPASLSQIILFWDAWSYGGKEDPLKLMINYRIASILSFLIPILLFLLALLIIFKSEQIGTFLLRKDQVPTDEQSIRLSDTALNISIKVFGIYSILSSIPHIASLLSTYLVMRENVKYFDNQGMIKLASSGVSTILYVGVGIGLIFYSKALANKIMNIDSRTV